MTENKRFFILKDEEYDDVIPCIRDKKGELDDIYGHYRYDNINQICDKLNAFHEENVELKSELKELKEIGDYKSDRIKESDKENEKLKQINNNLGDFRNFITEQNVLNEKQRKELQLQMLRLYNYFENWFEDTMSPNAFSEMWDNIKEDKKWEKGDDE